MSTKNIDVSDLPNSPSSRGSRPPVRVRDTGRRRLIRDGSGRHRPYAVCEVVTPGTWRGEWYETGCVVRVPVDELGEYVAEGESDE